METHSFALIFSLIVSDHYDIRFVNQPPIHFEIWRWQISKQRPYKHNPFKSD